MKALILAAGLGSRLAPITDNCPKSLVQVNGVPILIKQISNLRNSGITDITVVAGYKSEVLIDTVKKYSPGVKIIVSVDYATTNNMYSAYMGRESVEDSDFLMMNADVFFDASVIKELLLFKGENAIVTDIGNYIEESMKVVQVNGRLVEISKQIKKDDALGSSIDVYRFSKQAGLKFFEKCSEYINEKKDLKKWSEVALNDILGDIKFEACPLVGRWFEIDNHEDLKAAEELFNDKR